LQEGGAARKALGIFSETYWPPLYTFVRRRGYSPGDAQDIVQVFFEHLLEQNTLSRADREKGRLRTFLLGSLQNFLLKQHERMRAIKRGGGHQLVSFDDQLIDAEAAMQVTAHLSDVNSYEIAWASSIVTGVEECARKVCSRGETRMGRIEQAAAEGGSAIRCSCSICRSSIRQRFGRASSIRFRSARMFDYEKNNTSSLLSKS
jgi:hypothetical protein